jgi:hypothetical protein
MRVLVLRFLWAEQEKSFAALLLLKEQRSILTRPPVQGCQILLGTWYQNRKNVPNEHKMYQMVTTYPKMFQMAN